MTQKKKTAFSSKAGRPEKTASNTTARKNTIPPSTRQRIKQRPARLVCATTEGNTASAQRQRILEHLKCDSLTTLQARLMGIMHPAMRVCELRKQGHAIATEWTTEYCPGGVWHRVARYSLNQMGDVVHD